MNKISLKSSTKQFHMKQMFFSCFSPIKLKFSTDTVCVSAARMQDACFGFRDLWEKNSWIDGVSAVAGWIL